MCVGVHMYHDACVVVKSSTVSVPRIEMTTRLGSKCPYPLTCFANLDVFEASTFLNEPPS